VHVQTGMSGPTTTSPSLGAAMYSTQPISTSWSLSKVKRSPVRSQRSKTPSGVPDCTLHGAPMVDAKFAGVCRSGYSFSL
jgi:hypothetical protein